MPVTIDGTSGVNTPSLTTSGSTVPVNGLYLPTTNTLGLATNSVERVRIDASGNLGIGTSSPGYKLEVSGSARVTSKILGDTGTAAAPSYTFFGWTDTGIWNPTGTSLGFSTAGAERMRLDISGNLGLGVTPSAWGSAWRAIQLGTQAAWYTNNDFSRLSLNVYGDSVYTERYLQTDHASQYIQASGNHTFMGADSGTAGNAITWTTMLNFKKDNTVALQGANFVAGTGITFPATQSASTDANTLDDYEEGTWTPVLNFGGSSTGITYDSSDRGYYTKVGNIVTVFVRMVLTSKGAQTGGATITGLPFTSKSVTFVAGCAIAQFNDLTFANQLIMSILDSSTQVNIEEVTEAGVRTAITNSDFTNSTRLSWSATYLV